MESSLIPDVKKIAVLRANSLGDLVFALPALDALRRAYPQAEIVFLGASWHAEWIEGRLQTVDRVETVPQTEGVLIEPGKRIDPDEQAAFFERMRAEQFDLGVQLHGGGRYSNPFLKKLGARVSIGAKSEDAEPTDRWIPYVYYQHEVIRNLEVVGLAGAHTEELSPRLPVLPADLQAAEPALRALGEAFIVIHPGSTDIRRCWPPAFYAEVADYCIGQLGLPVAVTGVEEERAQVSEMLDAMVEQPHNLCGQLSQGGLVGLLSRARLVVTNNTGPLHLALAVGSPALGLFTAEMVVNALPFQRGTFFPIISWNRTCPLCGKYLDKTELDNKQYEACGHAVSMLDDIPADEVMEAVEMMLARQVAA